MDLLKLFQHTGDVESYREGDTIFRAGDPATGMYVILDGEVDVRAGDTLLERSRPGDLLGEMALISDHRRSATATAATDCRLTPINERRFLFLVQETPFFALHVMRVLAGRIRRREHASP